MVRGILRTIKRPKKAKRVQNNDQRKVRNGHPAELPLRAAQPVVKPVPAAPHALFPTIVPGGNRSLFFRVTKRAIDILGAVTCLLLLSPLLLLVLLVLTISTGGKPIFLQDREGQCGKIFKMFKFRTMVINAEELIHLVVNEQGGAMFKNSNDPRITRFGRFLRAFSIDELPQLVNVLRGEMSLVGPRPMVAKDCDHYEPWQRRRLAVRPGITGPWQVSGRSRLGWADMVRLDIDYCDHQSLLTDLQILVRTPMAVFVRRGAC